MREAKARAYDVLGKISEYMKEYADVLDKPRRKYMRDMILGSIRSNSLILSQMAQTDGPKGTADNGQML